MSLPQVPAAPQQPPAPPVANPAVQSSANLNQAPYSISSQGHGEQFPTRPYAGAPLQSTPANTPSRKQLWIGLCAGFAAGIVVSILFAGIGSVLTTVTASHALQKAVDGCSLAGKDGVSVGDKGASLTIDTKGKEDSSGASWDDAACVLTAMKVPDSVVAKIDATSALQGRQTAAWDTVEASWTYHPDSGVKIIFTNAKN
jgi:hypothetical protein